MLGGLLTFSEKMTKLITFEDIFQATILRNKSSVIFALKKFDILHQSSKTNTAFYIYEDPEYSDQKFFNYLFPVAF